MIDVGFIGLGIMGRPMAGHLQAAGHRLFLCDVGPIAPELVAAGGIVCKSGKEVAAESDVVIVMVPDTPQVEAVLFGADGVAEGISKGKIVIDMSSISPLATKEFARKINARGADYLDAPVSGGEVGAKAASLTIMVGGPEKAFNAVKPLFERMGKNITLVGGNGDGQTTKVANQIIVALTIEAVGEALLFASKAGADPALVRQALMEFRPGLPDRTASEGSQPGAGRRAGTWNFSAQYRHGAAIVQFLCGQWRRGLGPLRHGQGAGDDGQPRNWSRLTTAASKTLVVLQSQDNRMPSNAVWPSPDGIFLRALFPHRRGTLARHDKVLHWNLETLERPSHPVVEPHRQFHGGYDDQAPCRFNRCCVAARIERRIRPIHHR